MQLYALWEGCDPSFVKKKKKTWIKPHPRMLYVKIGGKWASGSLEEDF